MNPSPTPVLVGDRDRENTANVLGQALAQGYLDITEYERRVQAGFAAHTAEELRQLVTDLPVARLRRSDPSRAAARSDSSRARSSSTSR